MRAVHIQVVIYTHVNVVVPSLEPEGKKAKTFPVSSLIKPGCYPNQCNIVILVKSIKTQLCNSICFCK